MARPMPAPLCSWDSAWLGDRLAFLEAEQDLAQGVGEQYRLSGAFGRSLVGVKWATLPGYGTVWGR